MSRLLLALLMASGALKQAPAPRPRIVSQQVYTPERCDPKDPLPCQAVIVQVENPLADDVSVLIMCETPLNAAVVSLPRRMRVTAPIDLTLPVHGNAPCSIYSYAR